MNFGNRSSYNILDVQVDAITIAEAAKTIIENAADPSSPAAYVTKPYVEFLDLAAKDASFQKVLNNSALCLPDGVALIWAAHYLYDGCPGALRLLSTLAGIALNPASIRRPLPEAFSGINFTWPLLALAAQNKLKVYLIGSPKAHDIKQTARFLEAHINGLQIVGTWPGRFEAGREQQLAENLAELRPDLILVGMGFPKQEFLMSRLVERLSHGVLIGEGGTFDYRQFGGNILRAPRIVQHLGLEWLWRLIREPSRLIRQLAIPRFIWRVYRQGRN
jgi:N-acetylglucosaminyldiphosphoundecaprenol N-acetyl-beta-D-mannosaminyltransferase